jgi:copper chaperone NosL
MKPVLTLALIAVLLFTTWLSAAELADQQQTSCSFCGMDRFEFAHSRMLLDYAGESAVGTCSLHCTASALTLSTDNPPTTIKASDFHSKQLIDAKKAFWVLGGYKPGTMTARGKWAFHTQTAAEQFVSSNGGSIVDFNLALNAAFEDFNKDSLRLHKRGPKKAMAM